MIIEYLNLLQKNEKTKINKIKEIRFTNLYEVIKIWI